MIDWMVVTMTDKELVEGKHEKLQAEFIAAHVAAGTPSLSAMLAGASGAAHFYYFSPRAVALFAIPLQTWGAVPCSEPTGPGLSLFVGDENTAWGMLA